MSENDADERMNELAEAVLALYGAVESLMQVVGGDEPGKREDKLKAVAEQLQYGYGKCQAARRPKKAG